MSFQFIDGFDVYPDVATTPQGLQACWVFENAFVPTLSDMSLVAGRFGGLAVRSTAVGGGNTAAFGQPVTAGVAFAVGFAFRLDSANPPVNMRVCTLWSANNASSICGIGINQNQQLFLFGNGGPSNVVATVSGIVQEGSWHYVELEATIDSGAGVLNLYKDGLAVATFTGNTGTGNASFISFGFSQQDIIGGQQNYVGSYDDVYCKNVATHEGERRVQSLVPVSDAAVAWTPLVAGSNYSEVNELPVNGDTSYVYASAVNTQDLYGISSLTGSPTAISAVQVRICARKDDAAGRTLSSVLKSGASVTVGPAFAVSASYQYIRDIYPNDPNTSALWTGSGVDAAQIGQKVIS
jgi:hypothetical protein